MRKLEGLANRLLRYNEKLAKIPSLLAIRQGLACMMPLILLGSLALVVISLPIPAYQNLMGRLFGTSWTRALTLVRDGTYGIMSLSMVVSISYAYAAKRAGNVEQGSTVIVPLVSLASFIATLGLSKTGFDLSAFGVTGMFVSIMTAVLASALFCRLSAVPFLRLRLVLSDGADSVFSSAMASMFPAFITVCVFALFTQGLTMLFHVNSLQQLLSEKLTALFLHIQNPVLSGFLFVFMVHLLWMFGIHGSNVLESVAQSIFVPALLINEQLLCVGHAPTMLFSKTFIDAFVLMGGCGTSVCLLLALLFVGRQRNSLRLAKISVLPVMFNINEPIVFGLPVVLNPIYLVPFLGVPLLLTGISALAVTVGLVPYTAHMVEWTTPILLSGYVATGSVAGSILQLFNLCVGTACYIPFVRLANRASQAQMKAGMAEAYDEYRRMAERRVSTLLFRSDQVGNIARALAAELTEILRGTCGAEQAKALSLHYQPQVDYSGKIIGYEALLRWKHAQFGFIAPPLIIGLAEEAGLIDELGNWILKTACTDYKRLNDMIVDNCKVSVNVSAIQLESERFVEQLSSIIQQSGIPPQMLEIEITEQVALSGSQRVKDRIEGIRALGVKLAMDDFGMGHSSLMYLKEYAFDTVKIDGSLVREIVNNKSCRNIVSTIVSLGRQLEYEVIAEFVERPEQRLVLHELGCRLYQGFLYSCALPLEEIADFTTHHSESARLDIS